MLLFNIFLWIVSIINLVAYSCFVDTLEDSTNEAKSSSTEFPYPTCLIGFSVLFAMACPGINVFYLESSLKILRDPAKKLWKKIRAKVSIWRD